MIVFSSRNAGRAVLAAVLLVGVSSTALAQSVPATPPEGEADSLADADTAKGDIVVTATRTRQALSRVPISVAAYTQERMDSQGVRTIADITRLTPGLSLTARGSGDVSGNNRVISIRGIASTVGSSTTGVYVDDTPIQTRSLGNATANVFPQVFDLERVEVLRGPQGTLFGAGAQGGVVRFITPTPSLTDVTGYGRAELAFTQGGAPSVEAGAAVSAPIVTDELGLRVSGWVRRDGGYVDRVDPVSGATVKKNSNSTDSYIVRGALKWAPVADLTATASYLRQDVTDNDSSTFFTSYSDRGDGRFNASRVIPSTAHDVFDLPSLTMQYDGADYSIISTTSYFRRDVERQVDYTNFISSLLLGGPYNYGSGEYSSAAIDDTQRTFSQEVRVQSSGDGPLTWAFGGFYSHSKQTTYQYNYDPYFNTARARRRLSTLTLLNGNSVFETQAEAVDEQKAVFGEASLELLAGLKATAGVRVAAVDLRATRLSQGPVAGGTVSSSASQSETPVTPKFGLSYQASSATLLYATAAKGYRIGGVNGPQNSLCQTALAGLGLTGSPTAYKSDTLWSYEAGAKTRLLGGLVRVEGSVFDIYWKNIQRGITLSSCGSGFIANFGDARSTGFDLSVEVRPSASLSLGGNVGYANARLSEDVLGTGTTVYGRKGDGIGGPPWTFTLFGEVTRPVRRAETYARVDYQHIGAGADINYTVYGADPLVPASQAYDQVSLRAGVRIDGVDVSLFINNLLDVAPLLTRQRYTTAYSSFFQDSTIRPRTIGMTVSHHF